MNILPKKRWHVRTRENITRVRRDEANAAKEEEEKQRRIKLAEQEARTNLLRARARSKYDGRESVEEDVKKEVDIVNADGHVNFFAELEQGLVSGTATNKDHDEELKQEREKYEKQIGYLTYLGQDTNEATGNVSWYNRTPARDRKPEKDEEIGLKHKVHNDPLNSVKQFCFSGMKTASSAMSGFKRKHSQSSYEEGKHKPKKSKKEKKKKKKSKHKKKTKKVPSSDSESSDSESSYSESSEEEVIEKKRKLENLRAERVRREEEEKKRSEKLLAKVNGLPYKDKDEPEPKPAMQRKYNSQFNPTLARQNYRD